MGGLAAAKAIAPHFEQVVVLDRDALPEGADPAHRHAAGAPRARAARRQASGRSSNCFRALASDFKEAGAVMMRVGRDLSSERPGYDPFPRRDLGFDAIFCLSRP